MTPERLTAVGTHWQKVLRLEQWNIAFRLVRCSEIDGNKGRCSAQMGKWDALIQITDPIDAANVQDPNFPHDLERTLVHELLHLHLWHMDTKADSPEGHVEERAIDALSGVLVNLHRAPKPEKERKRCTATPSVKSLKRPSSSCC